jgi:hypothetical protein
MSAPVRDTSLDSNGAVHWRPGKLWSLGDMLKFNARAFYNAVTFINSGKTLIQERKDHKNSSINKSDRGKVLFILDRFEKSLDVLGAQVTIIGVRDLMSAVKVRGKKAITNEKLGQKLTELDARLSDELSLVHLFVVETTNHKYFEPKDPLFGKDFNIKFPTAVFEVDEAGKCLALGRSTASVFHLMRIMEIGVRAVARCLKIPDPIKPSERNWGDILRKIKEAIEFKTKTTAWTVQKHKDFFETSYASLDAVRAAWRNTTMHVENKYTPDEAEHILLAVRAFMRTLSAQMNEAGQPEA